MNLNEVLVPKKICLNLALLCLCFHLQTAYGGASKAENNTSNEEAVEAVIIFWWGGRRSDESRPSQGKTSVGSKRISHVLSLHG